MEIIIILIVVVILGYVIFQSLPEQKFKKATALFELGNFAEAFRIYESIFLKHPDAPAKLAECRLIQGRNAKERNLNEAIHYFNEAIQIKNRISKQDSKQKYELVEAKAIFEIAYINFRNALSDVNTDSKISKIKDNVLFIDNSLKSGSESSFADLKNKNLSELAELYFSLGLQSEKSNKLSVAIQFYSDAINFATKSSNTTISNSSLSRIGISKLKNKDSLSKDIFDAINSSYTEYKKDFYFRYAKQLFLEKKYLEAEKIILTYLNFSSSIIDKLKEAIKAEKIKEVVTKIDKINHELDQLYENSFPVEDVKILYETLDKRIDEIKLVLPSLSDKLKDLKPSLFNRLLTHYISEEQYGNAIVLIQKFPSFWESPELLKNLGICCYAYVSQGNLNEKNYRTIISNWLTAVFCDKVILKSLEETSWDDDFTFTLLESIGSNYQQHSELPKNVNYDRISDLNISIGATQSELLQQFESLVNQNISYNSIANNVLDFYSQEKEAIQKIVAVINTEILFAAPHFAKTYGLNIEIIKELENDYSKYFDEESLYVGIPYIKDKTDGLVSKYALAKELVAHLLFAIKTENIRQLQSILADSNKVLVEQFKTIKESVEDAIYNAFNTKIDENPEDEKLITLMNECIFFTSENEKLKYQYSSYVANFCIAKVNDDEIDNYKALHLMKNAYLYSKENGKICKNIVTLIRYNLMDIANDKTNKQDSIYKILDSIKNNRSNVFKDNAKELAKTRTDILNDLKKTGVDISQFTGTFSFNLTREGEKLKRVLAYMHTLSE